MENNLHSSYSVSSSSEEEEYIDMEVDHHQQHHQHHSSFDNSIFSQSTNKEFEFQSFSSSSDRDHTTTSPADELFYMGKLLPLHLPPRLEMVNKILENSTSFDSKKVEHFEDEIFSTPLFTPISNTPFESCNISPSESCQVSRELDPNEYFVEYLSGFQENKKSWTKKIKMIKQSSSIGSKLKWANLKSLFTKSSGCSDEYSAAAAAADQRRHVPEAKQCVGSSHCKAVKNSASFGKIIKHNKDINLVEDYRGCAHRRSFSGAFKRLSKPKSSSTPSTSSSTIANLNRNALKKSISSNSEIESPIQAAIAHCKRSYNSRQVSDELVSASSRVVYD